MGRRNRLRVERIRAGTEQPLFPSSEARREEKKVEAEKTRQLRKVMRRHPAMSPLALAMSPLALAVQIEKEEAHETIRSSENTEQNNQGE